VCRRYKLAPGELPFDRWARLKIRPSNNNPPGTRNPVFAAVTAEARRAAVKALRSFRAWYRHAYQCFCQGERHTEFPPGTWGMARRFGTQVAAG